MKKISIIAALALGLSACVGTGKSAEYQLTVKSDNLSDGDMVYLVDYDTNTNMDSVVVADGVAQFKGVVKNPYLATLGSNGNRLGMLIMEPGELTVDNGEVTGGKLNEEMNVFETATAALVGEYRATDDDAVRAAINEKYDALVDSMKNANADNPIGYFLFYNSASGLSPEEFKAALEANPQFANYQRVQKLQGLFDAKDATSVGKKFIDFEIEYNGETTRLSDFVGNGKYVLVDFWASWCGPCRREASTTLKDIYNEYADKGLEIVGIAIWDEPENTLAAIENMELPWKQVLNGQSVPTDAYGIPAIPCIILFGPDGTILSRDLQGDDLKAAVAEAMATATEVN